MPAPPDAATATPVAPDQPVNLRRNRMWLYNLAFVVGGAELGFAYHKLVGCRSGACPITANPYISTLYGAFMAFIASGMMGK